MKPLARPPSPARLTILALLAASSLAAQSASHNLFLALSQQPAAVTINGFPWRQAADVPDSGSHTDSINRFLRQGTNELRITLRPLTKTMAEAKTVLVRARLDRSDPLVPNQYATLWQLDRQLDWAWSEGENQPVREVLTMASSINYDFNQESRLTENQFSSLTVDLAGNQHTYSIVQPGQTPVLTFRFTIPDSPFAALPWESAPEALTPAAEALLRAWVVEFNDALAAQNTAALLAKLADRTARHAPAMGLTVGDLNAQLTTLYDTVIFTMPAFTVLPVDPAALTFTTFPGLNLIEIRQAAGAPIRATFGSTDADKGRYELRLFFSFLDGQWKLVE